jgi:hypothetical protein
MTVCALGAGHLKVGHAGQQQTTAARVASAAVNSTCPTFHLARRPVWSSSRHRAAGTAQDGVADLGGHGVWGAQDIRGREAQYGPAGRLQPGGGTGAAQHALGEQPRCTDQDPRNGMTSRVSSSIMGSPCPVPDNSGRTVNSTPPMFSKSGMPVPSSSRRLAMRTGPPGEMCSAGESRRARGIHNARQPARVAVSSH